MEGGDVLCIHSRNSIIVCAVELSFRLAKLKLVVLVVPSSLAHQVLVPLPVRPERLARLAGLVGAVGRKRRPVRRWRPWRRRRRRASSMEENAERDAGQLAVVEGE